MAKRYVVASGCHTGTMINPVGAFYRVVAVQLSRAGLIDEDRGRRIGDLAWPRFLTMFARYLQRVTDVAMVGLTIGPTAIAGLAFATIYWGLANGFSLGLVGGTISQVSQRYGAGQHDRLDLAVKQSLWIGMAIALPFVLAFTLFPAALIGLVGDASRSVDYGSAYLAVLAPALTFNVVNLVSSRTLAGADDTWIAMSVRTTGALANIVFNAVFIFGLGMGVAGAALGTVLAEALITACFAYGFLRGRLPLIGAFPVTLSVRRPYFDRELTVQLLRITPPLMTQKLARALAAFPLFALMAAFGPLVVAAFEVGRRMRRLMRSTANGFGMAASSLVGQELGRGDELAAEEYASDLIRFSAVIYVAVAAVVVALARPLAHVFTDDPEAIRATVPFIRVAAVSFVAMGVDYSFTGILKAAGDNRWSMYSRLVSQYLVLIPLTFLGTVTPLGVTAVFAGMFLEPVSSGVITGRRVVSGTWKRVSRAHRPEAVDD